MEAYMNGGVHASLCTCKRVYMRACEVVCVRRSVEVVG